MHHNGEMKPKKPTGRHKVDRLTITLRRGQRKLLEAIAERNHVSLAFAVRHALDSFVGQHKDAQIPLQFPKLPLTTEEKI